MGQFARVPYVGKLEDGKVFENSRTKNIPFTFAIGVGLVIRG